MENKEIIWCDKLELKITTDCAPSTGVCKPLPTDSDKVKKYKKVLKKYKKQGVNTFFGANSYIIPII